VFHTANADYTLNCRIVFVFSSVNAQANTLTSQSYIFDYFYRLKMGFRESESTVRTLKMHFINSR